MQVLISGASGLVGRALVTSLAADGHQVIRLVRSSQQAEEPDAILWSPRDGTIDSAGLEAAGRFDAAVHLAGEGIAAKRWTDAQKKRILESRVHGTRLLANARAGLSTAPGVFVSASAIGWYGDRGDEWLDESAEAGDIFLSEVCREWESATAPAVEAGMRVVLHRVGVVLSQDGGALAKMLTPFRLGLGGRVGSGQQYWSWISLEDLVRSIRHVIDDETIAGPVNAVAPHPATNSEFTRTLGKCLRRPTVFPLPAFVARLMLGQMADELLLGGARVRPGVLDATGFEWAHPNLPDALAAVLR